LQQACRASVVRVDVALDLVHRLPNACFCGEMHDRIDANQRRGKAIGIADIPMDELCASKISRWRC
jgi:hypothetical protein